MLEPWNNLSILPPPVSMFKSDNQFDTAALRHICNNIMRVLSKQSPLHMESALCSRFLYKYDKKFRNDIGYRNLKKVNTALKKYLTLNLIKDIDYFLSALPSDDDEAYLPTRQMLEYVLTRIIAFNKIMLRASNCSKLAAIFYLYRIKRGESHWMSLLPYALLCRLWSMCMVLLQQSTSWYLGLYQYLDKLKLKGLDFLPATFQLPSDLGEWLDLKNIDSFGKFDWTQKKFVHIDSNLVDDDEMDMLENILGYVNQTNEDETDLEDTKVLLNKYNDKELLPVVSITQVDHGEILSRESFKILLNTQTKIQEESPQHSHDKITDVKSLKLFINNEERYRNELDKKSLTSHLGFMQWQTLKNSLLKLCDAHTNRKIQRMFLKTWKEKCLDYM